MIRNGPLKVSKSLKKAENGPFGKNLFPITGFMSFTHRIVYDFLTGTQTGADSSVPHVTAHGECVAGFPSGGATRLRYQTGICQHISTVSIRGIHETD